MVRGVICFFLGDPRGNFHGFLGLDGQDGSNVAKVAKVTEKGPYNTADYYVQNEAPSGDFQYMFDVSFLYSF